MHKRYRIKDQMDKALEQQEKADLSFGLEPSGPDSSLWESVDGAPDLTSGYLDTRPPEERSRQ